MKKTLSIVLCVLLVLLAVACNNSPEVHTTHTWDDGYESLPATCTTAGTWTKTCTVCGITKDTPIEAKGHSHSVNAAPVDTEQDLYCNQNGIYTYRCNVCGQEYPEIVTPEAAKKAGKTVPHALVKGGKVTAYLDEDGKSLAAGIGTDDASYTEEKTEKTCFTAECLVPYCKGCGEKFEGLYAQLLKKPIAKTTSTAADFESVVGTWVWEKDSGTDKKDKTILNVRIYQNSAVSTQYDAEVFGSVYTSSTGVTKTVRGEATNLTLAPGVGTRSLSFTTPTLTDLTEISGKTFALTEENGVYKLLVDNTDVSPSESDSNVSYSLTFDSDHTKHTWTAMSNYGMKTINMYNNNDKTGTSSSVKPGHYAECKDCGIEFYTEQCHYTNDGNPVQINKGDEKSCEVCGYNGKAGEYLHLTVVGVTGTDLYLVPKNTTLSIPLNEFAFWNGLKEDKLTISTVENASLSLAGLTVKTTDDASVTYIAEK